MQTRTTVSLEEYAAFEYEAQTRHELIGGEIIPMPYTSVTHGRMVSNLSKLLNFCLEDKDGFAYSVSRMIYIEETEEIFYPDVVVIDAEHQTRQVTENMFATTNPSVLIEVLSESTAKKDQTDKRRAYKTLPSLKQYFLFSQEDLYAEMYSRLPQAGQWLNVAFEDPEALLPIGNCTIKLKDVYKKVIFEK